MSGWVFSYPGVMEHAEQAALALEEIGQLKTFATTFVYRQGGALDRLARLAPAGLADRARRQLARRAVMPALSRRVRSVPMLEIVRTLAAPTGPVWVDRIWDASSHHFDRTVAGDLKADDGGVVAFEYAALETFRRAKELGLPCVLQVPSLENRSYRALEQREKAEWPELAGPNDAYFDAKFEARQRRREAEIALADLIIANSSLTARSHVAGGADPAKVISLPLGAPPPIAKVVPTADGPLRVLWSGSFVLRKGAHYLIEAWRRLGPEEGARLTVHGHVGLPAPLLSDLPAGIELAGSIPRADMLKMYEGADVLVFPTLSDGWGMAVTEALSRGVPVITTDQAGAADLIEHGRNGLIVPAADSDALAQALSWCLDNREALRAMRPEALAAAARHQWPDYRRRLMAKMSEGLRAAGFSPAFG